MRSIPAVVAAVIGAAIATACLIGPTTFSVSLAISSGSIWHELYDSAAATAAVAALVAFAAAVSLRHCISAIVGATVGLMGLIVAAVMNTPGRGVSYPTAIAAGLILGGLSVALRPGPAGNGHGPRVGLAAGVVAGFFLARSEPFAGEQFFGGNRRYADYLPGDLVSTESGTGMATVIGAVVALVALVIFGFQSRAALTEAAPRPGVAVIISGVGIPIVSFLLYWWMRASISFNGETGLPSWMFGSLVIVVVLAAAVILPARTGLAWVGVAGLVASAAAVGATGGGWVSTLVGVVLIAAGAFLARWRDPLPVAMAILVVLILLQLMDGESTELVAIVAAFFGAPVAVSYVMAVCFSEPSSTRQSIHPGIVAAALAAPVSLSILRGGADFGWTAYTPLTDARSGAGYFDIGSTTETTVTISVLSLIAAGVAAWVISRRVPLRGERRSP